MIPISIEEKNKTVPQDLPEPVAQVTFNSDVTVTNATCDQGGLFAQIKAELGEIADFISLCKSPSATEQRKFALSHSHSLDAIADRINECAADIFGDIILEDVGGAYAVIEDYSDRI